MQNFHVVPTFTASSIPQLFAVPEAFCETQHLVLFQKQYVTQRMKFDDVKKIAVEMPEGAFLAGGAIASILERKKPNNYDFFFNGEGSFIKMANRIQRAEKDSFFHGYKAEEPLSSMVEFNKHLITYSKEGSPSVNLIRTRWFDSALDLVDKMDFTRSMIAVGSDLNITFSNRTMVDIHDGYIVMNRFIFEAGTAVRWRNLKKQGYRWRSTGGYDGWFADGLYSRAEQLIRELDKKGSKEDTRFMA